MSNKKNPSERKEVQERIDIEYMLDGKLSDVIENLKKIIPKEYFDSAYLHRAYSFDDTTNELIYKRPETDSEMNKRIEMQNRIKDQEKKRKKANKEQEFKTYLRLTKKYGATALNE